MQNGYFMKKSIGLLVLLMCAIGVVAWKSATLKTSQFKASVKQQKILNITAFGLAMISCSSADHSL